MPLPRRHATVQSRVLIGRRSASSAASPRPFISHDLGVIHRVSDRVAVLRGAALLESGPTAAVFAAPRHDDTRALLDAVPRVPARG